jgi:hypothetical protein
MQDCKHGAGQATACSQCTDAPVRRVEFIDGAVSVDGVPTRAIDSSIPNTPQNRAARRARWRK